MPLTLAWGATPVVFSNISAGTPGPSGTTISWNVAPGATGQVEYGTTTSYGSTTTLETNYLTYHAQVLSGLTAGTTYYYRVTGTNSSGGTGTSAGGSFTTSTPQSMYANIYGPGVAVDSRDNSPVDDRDVSYRFRASTTSNLSSVVLPWRWGSGYSLGTGGAYAISIQGDSGGGPSGTDLSSVETFTPSGSDIALSDTRHYVVTFGTPAAVTAGTLYHIRVHNTHGTPATNYSSLNGVIRALGASYGGTSPLGTAQPAYTSDLATLYGPSWTVRTQTPVFNITYADGNHDGQTYLIAGCGTGPQTYGGATMVRQRFTVSGGTRTVSGLYVRSKLLSGSGTLSVALRTSSAAVDSIAVPNASFTTLATGCNDNGPQWVGGAFSASRTLTNGSSYEVRLSCAAGSTFRLESPLREESAGGTGDRQSSGARWSDRLASPEVSTDSGGSWAVIYSGFPSDMPFYFTLA